jgi:predicted phage terminase large subunit-like protein
MSREALTNLAAKGLQSTDEVLERVRAKRAETSLLAFIELMWPVLEPGREFKRGKVVEVLCQHLEAVTRGEITRININVPPGCMKSLTTSVFWPTWTWIHQPWARFVAFAYSEDLTIRDNKKMRALIESELFQKHWGHVFQPNPKEWGAEKIANDKTGFKLATSIGGVGTGERGDYIIIDDPHNVREGESDAKRNSAVMWFGETLPTRVNDQEKSAMVMIMQRVHESDVAGFILQNLSDDWEHLCLPMRFEPDHPSLSKTSLGFTDWRTEDGELLWPDRFPDSAVQALERTFRAAGGEYAIAGQLQQRPAPREGGMFKRDDFIIIDPRDVPKGGQSVRGWDLAATKGERGKSGRAAYTVGLRLKRVRLGDKTAYYIEDVVRGQWSPHTVDEKILEAARADGRACTQDFPQDPGQAGKSQVAHFSSILDGYEFVFSPETGSKEDRARPFSSQVEAGNVYLVRAPWNGAFLAEAENFPNGSTKDQIDAASRAYSKLIRRRARGIPTRPEII